MVLLLFVHRAIMLIRVWTMVFVFSIMWLFVQDICKKITISNGKKKKVMNCKDVFFRILIVDFDYHMGDGVKVGFQRNEMVI